MEKSEYNTETVKVVIAEDEAIVRLDLKEILTEEGFDVIGEASRGDDAVKIVMDLKPDVAILDIKMPGLDGISAARQMQNEDGPAIVFLTAFSQRDLIEEARDAGAMAYLIKPFQRAEILPAIEVALARHQENKALEVDLANLTGENEKIKAKLEARKVLDQAKGKLMDDYSMTESSAFKFLQKCAMDNRKTMSEVSSQVISGELVP
ncbi:MAG: response regulator [Acidimicrobiales bacterium]|nr:response regulator [Acidimicrobiales bacterium]